MKYFQALVRDGKIVPTSLPAWGVWIEIVGGFEAEADGAKSLPAWGVWIEISAWRAERSRAQRSLPAWGVWIEI